MSLSKIVSAAAVSLTALLHVTPSLDTSVTDSVREVKALKLSLRLTAHGQYVYARHYEVSRTPSINRNHNSKNESDMTLAAKRAVEAKRELFSRASPSPGAFADELALIRRTEATLREEKLKKVNLIRNQVESKADPHILAVAAERARPKSALSKMLSGGSKFLRAMYGSSYGSSATATASFCSTNTANTRSTNSEATSRANSAAASEASSAAASKAPSRDSSTVPSAATSPAVPKQSEVVTIGPGEVDEIGGHGLRPATKPTISASTTTATSSRNSRSAADTSERGRVVEATMATRVRATHSVAEAIKPTRTGTYLAHVDEATAERRSIKVAAIMARIQAGVDGPPPSPLPLSRRTINLNNKSSLSQSQTQKRAEQVAAAVANTNKWLLLEETAEAESRKNRAAAAVLEQIHQSGDEAARARAPRRNRKVYNEQRDWEDELLRLREDNDNQRQREPLIFRL